MTKRYYTVALKLIGIIIIFTKKKQNTKALFIFHKIMLKLF